MIIFNISDYGNGCDYGKSIIDCYDFDDFDHDDHDQELEEIMIKDATRLVKDELDQEFIDYSDEEHEVFFRPKTRLMTIHEASIEDLVSESGLCGGVYETSDDNTDDSWSYRDIIDAKNISGTTSEPELKKQPCSESYDLVEGENHLLGKSEKYIILFFFRKIVDLFLDFFLCNL